MTRNLLLDSALATFGEKGYVGTKIDDIVGRAGANRATFYLHFSSKGELVTALIEQINDTVVASDDPPLPEVVASGDPAVIRQWVGRRFDQWPTIMPYVVVAGQAADVEPGVADAVSGWHESAIAEIHEGLDRAERFDASSRRARAVAAFAQIEYFSRRWYRESGWTEAVPREVALEVLTDSWVSLLA